MKPVAWNPTPGSGPVLTACEILVVGFKPCGTRTLLGRALRVGGCAVGIRLAVTSQTTELRFCKPQRELPAII